MIRALLKVLNVEAGEEKPVLLLLGNGFFMGIFLASYKSMAYTSFLNEMGHLLREAIFVSGFLGVISTAFYAYAQRRIPFSRLIIINYALIFIFIAAARIISHYTDATWINFLLYVMHGPIMSILLLSFWGTFGRIFDLRQSKRIIGGIDSGQLTATIIAFFSIPFIINFLSDISDLLVIGMGGIVLSSIFLVILISNFDLNAYKTHLTSKSKESKFRNLIKNKYVVFLALFLFSSMLAFSFVDYSFLSVADQQYPDQKKLLSFISMIEGSVLVIGLIVQTFVNERLISMYGLKVTLLVLPIVLTIFTLLAIGSGYFFGFQFGSSNFIWFFLFITTSKLFTSSLREAMENPVFKLFFMPLDDKVRFDIQTKVEGIVNEFSRLVAGAVIFMLGLLPFMELIHYSIILLFIIAGWVFLALRIYQNYRVSIRYKLERQKRGAENEFTRHSKNYIFNILFTATKSDSPTQVIFALKVMAKLFPLDFKVTLDRSIKSKNDDFGALVLNKLKEDDVLGLNEHKGKDLLHEGNFLKDDKGNYNVDLLLKTVKEADAGHRKAIAEKADALDPELGFKILIELLNDTNHEVVNAAIISAGRVKRKELLPFLVDFLAIPKYRDTATDALINFGEEVFNHLETAFFVTDQLEDVKLRIIGIYGRIGGKKAINLLWSKIEYPDYKVVSAVLLALSQCGFKAHGQQISRIKMVLETDISNILWNLMALETLRQHEDDEHFYQLINALMEENEHNYNHIYMLLSMIFDQKSIQLVKENIETRTNEGVTYALELLDVFLPEDIKQKIIPILDDISDAERVRRLQVFYPQVEMDTASVVKAIVNRDFNQTNRWTKACAFYCIGSIELDKDYTLELIANLFNPDALIQETAAWALYQKDRQLYKTNITRIEEEERIRINAKLLDPYDNEDIQDFGSRNLRYHMIDFLKNSSSFNNLTGNFLSRLVDNMEEFEVNRDFEIDLVNYNTDYFFFVLRGKAVLYDARMNVEQEFGEGSYLGEIIFAGEQKSGYKLIMAAGTVCLQIEKNKFYDLVCNDFDITERILESFERTETEDEVEVNT